ncbi:conserved hypothetical protein [Ricinus communis]|uniref:Uncharacterized protein n=1 Tax=Ricinus communis TaxID=3988 RepID=B9T4E8_RICCO|nr:conserved hypothetical protein [Ricinus communis]
MEARMNEERLKGARLAKERAPRGNVDAEMRDVPLKKEGELAIVSHVPAQGSKG